MVDCGAWTRELGADGGGYDRTGCSERCLTFLAVESVAMRLAVLVEHERQWELF